MDPSSQWQQPDPNSGYGQQPPQGGYPQYPQQPPQYPQQPPQYPQQQPAQPYSAAPYATQPYSAPPAYQQPQYQQPQYQQQPPAYQTSAPPLQDGSGRRNRFFPALIISSVLLVIVVVAIVVVALNRGSDTPSSPQAGASTQSGPVDKCLVGKWKQTTYQKLVDLTGTDTATRANITKPIKMTGGGKLWEIKADGEAIEDDTNTVYNGKTDDGRTVTATWAGRTEWKMTTKDGQISYAGGEATTVVTISVDGVDKGRIELEPNLDDTKYTCNGDIWRTSSKDNDDDFSRYDRQK
ncbi:hypothetical protein ACQP00_11555 [Dactylosporangium sp. CS-047395]|uniref:hypothetical protein n=1 Tax=Dactylosporangium sp. CS-047395 TaxID=3239936 RepID=UPI003D93753C